MIKGSQRDINIDRARGIAVFTMVFFDMARGFKSLKIFSRVSIHDIENGIVLLKNHLTLSDLTAPCFFFFIAMTAINSLNRKTEQMGERKAYLFFVERYLALIGIDLYITLIDFVAGNKLGRLFFFSYPALFFFAISTILLLVCVVLYIKKQKDSFKKCLQYLNHSIAILGIIDICLMILCLFYQFTQKPVWAKGVWDALQSIGFAGLLFLPFMKKSTTFRSVSAVVVFLIYWFIHSGTVNGVSMMKIIDEPAQGGLIGALGWLVFLFVFTVFFDFYYKKNIKMYLISLGITLLLGFAGSFMVINHGSVSPGYILVNLPFCPLGFLVVTFFEKVKVKYDFLAWWGAKPLLMYLLEQPIVFLTDEVFSSINLPVIPSLLILVAFTAGFTFIGKRTYSKLMQR